MNRILLVFIGFIVFCGVGCEFTDLARDNQFDQQSANYSGKRVYYVADDATSGTVPVDETAYFPGDSVFVLGNPGNLTKSGYSFWGWNTKPDLSGLSYQEGDFFPIESGDLKLYILWWKNISGPGAGGNPPISQY